MGALTDHRKRSSADHRLPLSPLFSSAAKKPCVAAPNSTPSAPAMPSSFPTMPKTPQPSPHPRFIHAPQRNIRAFGLGSSSIQRWRPWKAASAAVNSFSRDFQRKPDEGLALHDYKKLVEEHLVSPSADEVKAKAVSPKSYLPELKEAGFFIPSEVPNLVVEDTRSGALESNLVSKERILERSRPLYKELYEKANKHDAMLNELSFSVKLYQQKAIGFRNVGEVLRKRLEKPKEDLDKLFGPLIAEEEEDISLALFNGSSSEVLVTHESSNIVITREVLQCLRPGAWLNDEVINLYLELLKEREKREPKKFLKCHFFSTFFYKRLISGKHGYDFKAVKRWTTQRKLGYALSECDKIFVPIHKEIHWCLAVINVKDESLQYLDSLGGLDNYALKMLARYLVDEVKDKSTKTIDTQYWKKESVDDLPLQKNGWDCGMFMLKYADFYSRGLKLCFGQEHMVYFRKRTALEILRLRAE
ncbi:Ubiquitin-like-specific protease ESD4 [Platanthera zijinensis]|uniref:Ubiquitin-like-specific protease ESD4 n=1 Tax=Platanthera zijinensis TaxID=2320716 RepID=A0AAP0BSN6_9ASPA